jgi:lipopolysaccharide/colanic/teichoic acid biosynthesis glycosyltransferase
MVDKALDRRPNSAANAERFDRLRGIIRPKAKIAIDFTSSLALFAIIFPLFLLIVLALLCTGQSPFYSHVRVGRGGREFGCLKFRSMRCGADVALTALLERDPAAKVEWEINRKLRRDPRVTRIGKILRATSLDEVPQLFNIMAGQMSLVGPRPVTRDEFVKFYGSDEAAAYGSVRPGLTGLWQVSGRSGTCYTTRVALDAQYAQRLSLRTDAVILFQTLNAVIRQKGAW